MRRRGIPAFAGMTAVWEYICRRANAVLPVSGIFNNSMSFRNPRFRDGMFIAECLCGKFIARNPASLAIPCFAATSCGGNAFRNELRNDKYGKATNEGAV